MRARGVVALALLATGAACSSRTEPVHITVLTKPCSGSPDPTAGVDHYRVVLTASDIPTPIAENFAVGSPAPIPQLPPGNGRTLTIYGYKGDPANGGTLLSFGQSAAFSIPSTASTAGVNVSVVLRPAGQFSGANIIASEGTCARLTEPRAAHTATLLQDGRVLFVGGFNQKGNSITYSGDAEVFDPTTFNTTAVAAMPRAGDARAYHTANLLPDGTVVIVGGENLSAEAIQQNPIDALRYDPVANDWGELLMGTNRTRHQAISDGAGHILILGGLSYDGNGNPDLVTYASIFDATTPPGIFNPLTDITFGAFDFGAAPIAGGTYITAGGGSVPDGGFPGDVTDDPNIYFFQFAGSDAGFVPVMAGGFSFSTPVHGVVAVPLGTAQDAILFAGGFTSSDDSVSLVTVNQLDAAQPACATNADCASGICAPSDPSVPGSPTVCQLAFLPLQTKDSLSQGRGDICAAALADGRALLTGGRTQGVSSNASELYQLDSVGVAHQVAGATPPTMLSSRVLHTCTVLHDGSVLVAGGMSMAGGVSQSLDSIEIYTPVPLNPM